jgi:hypothetical protein
MEISLTPIELWPLCKYPPMFKTPHLGVSKFSFLLLFPFRTKNHNAMSILSLTPKLKPRRFGNSIVLKLGVNWHCEGFSVRNEQSERKPKFDTPK